MNSPKTALTALLALGLLAAGAPGAFAASAQETADREGEQAGLSEEEVASPPELEAPEKAAIESTPFLDGFPYDQAIQKMLGKGNWGVEAVLFDANGKIQKLSGLQENKELMPASTMKMFTSWFGFTKNEELRALGREPEFPTPWISYEAYAAHTLKVSDNAMAMAILKKFAPTKGPDQLQDFYAKLGLAGKDSFNVVDGAGLSTGNRATAHLEVSLLSYIFNSGHYKEYRELLAEPGETGTLVGRLHGLKGSLYAKTGTLTRTRVAALAGFIDAGGAGTIIFSIIGNNPKLTVDVQRQRIDQVVETLHRDAAGVPATGAVAVAALRARDIGGKLEAANLAFASR